jgi:hypothetical protein
MHGGYYLHRKKIFSFLLIRRHFMISMYKLFYCFWFLLVYQEIRLTVCQLERTILLHPRRILTFMEKFCNARPYFP